MPFPFFIAQYFVRFSLQNHYIYGIIGLLVRAVVPRQFDQ